MPKRVGVGQALNLAHPAAKIFLAGMCIIPLALLVVPIAFELTK